MKSRTARVQGNAALDAAEPKLAHFYAHAGFLLRRAQHISVSLFVQECGSELTPPQFSALQVVQAVPGIDLAAMARTMGFDRATATLVVGNLVKRGFVSRGVDAADRRRQRLEITPQGVQVVERVHALAKRAEKRLLSPFDKDERRLFLDLLTHFVASFNDDSRTPVDGAALPVVRPRRRTLQAGRQAVAVAGAPAPRRAA